MSAVVLLRKGQSRKFVALPRNKISRQAMLDYLHNPALVSHDFIKTVPRDKLLNECGHFLFHTRPRDHQLASFVLGIDYPGFLFYMDMGGGKTKLMLDLIKYRKLRNGSRRALVVVPYPANTIVWRDELAIHRPDLKMVALTGTKAEREEALSREADIYVINYMGLFVMMSDLVRSLTKEEIAENKARDRRGTAKRYRFRTGRRINPELVKDFCGRFDFVVFDEGQFMGKHDTDQFELCRSLALKSKFCYVLTGTPFGRDPAPLWSQFNCVDLGETFGEKFGMFRSVFYDAKINFFAIEYKFNKKHEPDLNRMMRNRSIRYEDIEFSDIPPVTRQVIHVQMTAKMLPYYEQRRLELIDLHRTGQRVRLMENKYHQMRAITSGYVVGDIGAGEDKIRVRSKFEDNPKMEALRTLLASVPLDRKITVFHEYVYSGDLIADVAGKLKYGLARLGGGRDGVKELDKFLNDPNCRLLLAQSKAGGVGSNLQHVCNYCVYYESPTSPIVRKQSEARFPRTGQKRRVFIYDIIMDNTIDIGIQSDLQSGLDFINRVLRPNPQAELPLSQGARDERQKLDRRNF